MKKKTLTQVIGYEIGAQTKKLILADVQATGKSLEECATAYSLPVILLPTDNEMITECGITYTLADFRAAFPYRKIVIIKSL